MYIRISNVCIFIYAHYYTRIYIHIYKLLWRSCVPIGQLEKTRTFATP